MTNILDEEIPDQAPVSTLKGNLHVFQQHYHSTTDYQVGPRRRFAVNFNMIFFQHVTGQFDSTMNEGVTTNWNCLIAKAWITGSFLIHIFNGEVSNSFRLTTHEKQSVAVFLTFRLQQRQLPRIMTGSQKSNDVLSCLFSQEKTYAFRKSES